MLRTKSRTDLVRCHKIDTCWIGIFWYANIPLATLEQMLAH
jgi:hypothetical protein